MQRKHLILPILFLFIAIALTTKKAYATDSPLVITEAHEGYTLENIKLEGNGTGTAITIINSSRIILRNVTLTSWACGINTTNGIFNSYYDLNIQQCDTGWHINGVYGINRAYGGSIINNHIGVLLSNGTCMNQFYGTEIECNTGAEIQFGSDTYGNLFEGCYFERTETTSNDYFQWHTTNIGSNTFIANKFASQGDSVLTLKGDANVFTANLFHGASQTCTWDLYGSGNSITNNRAVYQLLGLIFTDHGTSNTLRGNYFCNVNINQVTITTSGTGSSAPDFPEILRAAVYLIIVCSVFGVVAKIGLRAYNAKKTRSPHAATASSQAVKRENGIHATAVAFQSSMAERDGNA